MAAEYSFCKRNGLSLVLAALFLAFWIGQILTGQAAFNAERVMDGLPPLGLLAYVTSGHAISATFENWESEFLQMGMYVLLTVWLRQQGSAESRPLDPAREEEEIEPGPTPWPVRAGGLVRRLYANSLSLAFLALFAIAFVLHGLGSWKLENEERAMQGQPPVTLLEHVGGAQFWFESMQNWQSEFLAVLSIVVLSIWLRQDRSPESKPVAAPHVQTGA
ncbi:DUF6766 family protein [Pseudoxanthomonas sp.]|uniref:DUF6766 family protein n=1 Tax=Pseudoxanthomonas sp. TaxID=1871049 RepID=UPI002589DC6D|nr:DUF6766 family protein [Pseudoxanthomonas sp.]MCR6686382.1 hypothetical protein [Pseudoxanthomonas sp.]